MFWYISKVVKELCAQMQAHPHDWVQREYHFQNIKYPDLMFWTANGFGSISLEGNKCFTLAEKYYIARSISKTIALRLSEVKP